LSILLYAVRSKSVGLSTHWSIFTVLNGHTL
jgi:hypothetical protein